MAEHLARARTAFNDNTPSHTSLLKTLSSLTEGPVPPVVREVAGMAAMKVLSRGLPPQGLVELTHEVEKLKAEDKLGAVALLLSALSD
jgi:hypothetical protein